MVKQARKYKRNKNNKSDCNKVIYVERVVYKTPQDLTDIMDKNDIEYWKKLALTH